MEKSFRPGPRDGRFQDVSYLPDDLSPMARQMLQGLAAAPRPPLAAEDWRGLRQRVEQDAAVLVQMWRQSGVDFAVEGQSFGGVPCVWVRPPTIRRRDAVVLYTHGGGFVSGSAETLVGLLHGVAVACGLQVLSIDYRLAPEHPFPAAVDDATAVYRGLLQGGFEASRIGWLGDSAGGGLALSAVQVLAAASLPTPAAMVLLSPWLDLSLGGDSAHAFGQADPLFEVEMFGAWARLYAAGASLRDPALSPLFGQCGGLPPLLVQCGSKELLLSDAWRLARRVRRGGGHVELDIWDGLWHLFQGTPGLPEGEQAVQRIGTFLRRHLP